MRTKEGFSSKRDKETESENSDLGKVNHSQSVLSLLASVNINLLLCFRIIGNHKD